MLTVSHCRILNDSTSHHADVSCRQRDAIDVTASIRLERLEWLRCPASAAGRKAKNSDVSPPLLANGQITTAVTVIVTKGH